MLTLSLLRRFAPRNDSNVASAVPVAVNVFIISVQA
jgi:hypothetical protein